MRTFNGREREMEKKEVRKKGKKRAAPSHAHLSAFTLKCETNINAVTMGTVRYCVSECCATRVMESDAVCHSRIAISASRQARPSQTLYIERAQYRR